MVVWWWCGGVTVWVWWIQIFSEMFKFFDGWWIDGIGSLQGIIDRSSHEPSPRMAASSLHPGSTCSRVQRPHRFFLPKKNNVVPSDKTHTCGRVTLFLLSFFGRRPEYRIDERDASRGGGAANQLLVLAAQDVLVRTLRGK